MFSGSAARMAMAALWSRLAAAARSNRPIGKRAESILEVAMPSKVCKARQTTQDRCAGYGRGWSAGAAAEEPQGVVKPTYAKSAHPVHGPLRVQCRRMLRHVVLGFVVAMLLVVMRSRRKGAGRHQHHERQKECLFHVVHPRTRR